MIKFNQHAVVNTETGKKARVHYSIGNRIDGRQCVTIYAKDYGSDLANVFSGYARTKNDSDSYTDYFETSRVCLFEDSGLYAEAKKAAEIVDAKRRAKKDAEIERFRTACEVINRQSVAAA